MKGYIPTRMCAICRNRYPKDELIRLAKDGEKLSLSNTIGRGIYVCTTDSCQEKIKNKKILNKIIKCDIPDEIYKQLIEKEGV